ncbi:RtcB family protein [Candidatus Woesearchaeota archaeon]|nr:RtcB family protein [Candidatus Woesearchaeota archaeon]
MINRDVPVPEFTKISENIWEIPTSYKKGMLVPARIYASQQLLKDMDLAVYDQLTNVACLPGIQKHALCMPDGHSGYGFPIGGVAAFDTNSGVISPGGIGFDINCLAKDTKILSEFGYTRPVQEFEQLFNDIDLFQQNYILKGRACSESLVSLDRKAKSIIACQPAIFMKKKQEDPILKIVTKTGYEVEVTPDHPILTKTGMIPAGQLEVGNEVAILPFQGVTYEELPDLTIVSNASLFSTQELQELKKRTLFPLNLKNPAIPLLAKIFGYLLGDGHIYLSGKKGFVCAYGAKEDLQRMQNDFERLGFSAGIYSRTRNHSIPTKYGTVKFTAENHELHVSSKALTKLFFAMEYPKGNKTTTPFEVPTWILRSPLWLKRLFLAGFFGAELSKPRTHTKTGFDCPVLSMNKNKIWEDDARQFCIQIMSLLDEFGIKTDKILQRDDYKNKHGKTVRLRIQLSSEEDNLIKLYSTMGFEYNRKRTFLAHCAVLYMKEKKHLTQERAHIAKKIKELRARELTLNEVKKLVHNPLVNERFITRHYYENATHRIPLDFCSFNQFVEEKTKEQDSFGTLFDTIDRIEKTPYNDYVYDFTIPETHNFVANNILISNCGMRLITTNLTLKEVKPKLKMLVDMLFQQVPSGVGAHGFVKTDKKQFRDVMAEGARWCVDNGYGWDEDLERIEDYGRIEQADPSLVSEKAVGRGFNQLGTLGSGNHYLEIQHAGEIFDEKTAEKLGITSTDQVCVMVHCGSRGFGHQIATDYLKIFHDVMKREGITIRDPELSCAPFASKEGQNYFKAMACAANMAFTNRQVIQHRIRECFKHVFEKSPEEMEMHLVYDVAHNIAKIEEHKIDGKMKKLIVHRKGATRCFGPERKELAPRFRKIGQPVILGGSMETGSYLLLGTDEAEETFGSTAHGSGRTMSRTKARHEVKGQELQKKMEEKGIYVRTASYSGLAEEAGFAYKPISEVVDTMDKAGISKKIVAFKPFGNIKG